MLDIADNSLTEFSGIHLPKHLQQLTLSSNPMTELKMTELANCQTCLKSLIIDDSMLTNVTAPPDGIFQVLTELIIRGK